MPVVELARASVSRYSVTGLYQGTVGARNYARLLEQDALGSVAANTLVWVVAVVGVTVLISLALAQLLSLEFRGRRLGRWACSRRRSTGWATTRRSWAR